MILKRGAILPRRDHDIVIVEGAPGGDVTTEEQTDGRPPMQTRRVRTDGRPQRERDKSTNRNTNG